MGIDMDAPEGETDPTEIDATAAAVVAPDDDARIPPPEEPEEEPAASSDDERAGSRLEVSGTQVCASTLASVSGAVVASVFGMAGTVAGAAVMSVIATVAGALYTHGLRQTGEKLQQSPVVRQWWRPRRSMAAPLSPTAGNASSSGPPAWRQWLVDRRWGVVVATAGVFVASLLVVTVVELVAQRPLSGADDRATTSIGSLLSGSEAAPDEDVPDEAPAGTTDTSTSTDEDPPTPTDGTDGGTDGAPTTEEPPDDTTPTTEDQSSATTAPSSDPGSASAP